MNNLDFNTLNNMPGLTAPLAGMLSEAAAICLQNQKHASATEIDVNGLKEDKYVLAWNAPNTQQQRAYNDIQEATEWGACGIAILLVQKITGNVVVERSRKGTGFDYWLGKDDQDPLFTNKARLEISGILQGDDTQFRSRIKQKENQMNVTKDIAPGYVAVIEFSNPKAHVGEV